jgi:MFS family permease
MLFASCVAVLFAAYEYFLRTFVGSLAPQLMADWHLTPLQFSNMNTAYYIVYGVMQLPAGMLIGRYGVRYIIFFAVLLLVVATELFAHTNSYVVAFVARMLIGFGSSFAFVSLFYIVMSGFAEKTHGFAVGFSQFITTLGPMIAGGPLVLWIQYSHIGWRVAIADAGWFGLGLCLLALFMFRKTKRVTQACFGAGLQVGKNQAHWLQQLRVLLANKRALLVVFYTGATYVSASVLATFWGTSYLESVGLSQYYASSMVSLLWIVMAITCPLIGFISDRMQNRKLFLVLCAWCGLVASVSLLFLSRNTPACVVVLTFIGFGIAISGQSLTYVVVASMYNKNLRSSAIGLNNTGIFLFIIVIPFLVSLFISNSLHGHAGALQSADFQRGFLILPILYLTSVVLSMFFMRDSDLIL